jgi:hypothetical protein
MAHARTVGITGTFDEVYDSLVAPVEAPQAPPQGNAVPPPPRGFVHPQRYDARPDVQQRIQQLQARKAEIDAEISRLKQEQDALADAFWDEQDRQEAEENRERERIVNDRWEHQQLHRFNLREQIGKSSIIEKLRQRQQEAVNLEQWKEQREDAQQQALVARYVEQMTANAPERYIFRFNGLGEEALRQVFPVYRDQLIEIGNLPAGDYIIRWKLADNVDWASARLDNTTWDRLIQNFENERQEFEQNGVFTFRGSEDHEERMAPEMFDVIEVVRVAHPAEGLRMIRERGGGGATFQFRLKKDALTRELNNRTQ